MQGKSKLRAGGGKPKDNKHRKSRKWISEILL